MKNIGFAITGSFCTFDKILDEIQTLVDKGYNIIPILSFAVLNTDTRFYKAKEFYERIKDITKNTPIDSLASAEPVGPKNLIDVLVVAPCTGNTLAKLANAITDTPVTMVAKAHMRNYKPLIIAISSNDALGLNLKNIAALMTAKNTYFVPFRQDDPFNKPKSLISDMKLIEKTMEKAVAGEQLQPILIN